MIAMRRSFVLVLAVLLAAATAVADAVVVAEETQPCSCVSADSSQRYPRRPDTLAANASPAEMVMRCQDMTAMLRVSGRSDRTVAGLLREVRREEAAVRGIWPQAASRFSGVVGGLLFGFAGCWGGHAVYPTPPSCGDNDGPRLSCGASIGGPVGCGIGYVAGVAISKWRRASLIAEHRVRVNDLVRRVNSAIVTAP